MEKIKRDYAMKARTLTDRLERVVDDLLDERVTLANDDPAVGDIVKSMNDVAAELVQASKKEPDYWGHNICHLFEKTGRLNDPGYNSLLSYPEFFPAAEVILGEVVKNTYCAERTFGGLIAYNLMHIAVNGLDAGFGFLPECVRNATDLDFEEAYILQAATPAEMIERIRQKNYRVDYIIKYGNFGEGEAPAAEKLEKFLQGIGSEAAPEPEERLRKNGKVLEGIWCDVDGTLISSKGELNLGLAKKLGEAYARGVSVNIFTAGNPQMAETRLLELGVDSGNVKFKNEYIGKYPELLVDDTPGSALKWVSPRHALKAIDEFLAKKLTPQKEGCDVTEIIPDKAVQRQ